MVRNHIKEADMAYFPMFVDITDTNCLVVGGGEVALRKVKVLLDF
jgi:uroporphyrin-III C-methyltransferase/precorrin-2 dehydrogenase/sirohydrochlorin ferrochelatase/precorrin-2 dehydrogenase/sirohydrochlorin ferrochelatase